MTKCMACGKPLKPGYDYPRESTVVFENIPVEPDRPILCWDPDACIERTVAQARKEAIRLVKYFFFGKVFQPGSQDDSQVTRGKDFVVEGGSGKEHKDTVEIVRLFGEGIKMDGPHHAQEILRDAVKKVKGGG